MPLKYVFLFFACWPAGLWAQSSHTLATVNLSITLDTSNTDTALIVYRPSQPLLGSNFMAVPKANSPMVAETFSGFGIHYTALTQNKCITVQVSLSVYFNKMLSWCKPQGQNDWVLQHEQLHFDITALSACMFMNEVRTHSFSPLSYEKELDDLVKQYQHENEVMQTTYDRDSQNSTNKEGQLKWNENVKKWVEQFHCLSN
jgi:hypothetical protein